MSTEAWEAFAVLRDSQLRAARALEIKEFAVILWGQGRRGWAERAWTEWYDRILHSRLERVASLIKYDWDGVRRPATSPTPGARG